ncbi:GmrSD restriction endonuclease domain-containing protein [Nocardia gipuzkoensis]
MDGLAIREVIERVASGRLRIPSFQRGFVWDAERVAYLMDSMYKGYPFGAVILWRTTEQLKSERQLGPFELQDLDPALPIDYVLDGQQRLTSIFGVFQSEISPIEEAPWTNIYFDLKAETDLQESQFLYLPDHKVDLERHFPIGSFFNVPGYRNATKHFDDETADKIGNVQAAFQQASIPVQLIETDDRAKVAIVFERVNRMGMELDILQLLSAWTWSEDFDLQERFEEFAEELRPFGFQGVGDDSNLLLRCCAAVVGQDVSPKALVELNGGKVRDRFPEMMNGIKGAIDFLRANIDIHTLANLPYAAQLVPLSVFFAQADRKEVKVSDKQRKTLLSWFWRSCFSRRYSAGVIRNLNRDIAEALKLRQGQRSQLDEIPSEVEAGFFTEQTFNIGTVHTKVFVLLLAQNHPRSFVSGTPISLGKVLQAYNRNEFHHLYPQKFLKDQDRAAHEIGMLANFVFMSSADNKTLGGVAPSIYRSRMDIDGIPAILERAYCPASLFEDDYDNFIEERNSLLTDVAVKLMNPR